MRKRVLIYALAVVVVFICMGIADLNAEYVCGDANGDGLLNVSDAVYIINYVFIGGPAPDPDCCETLSGTVTDYDGNVYQTVKIGNQLWMMENLKVTHYRNGDLIPNVTNSGTWAGTSSGAYCNYNNNEAYVASYGRLYNWFAVADSRGIAPEGWHVPTDAEWKLLEMYLGMSQGDADATGWRGTNEGGKLKETGLTHWNSPNTGATNESGFTAVGAGIRYYDGLFDKMGRAANFWSISAYSSTHTWTRELIYTEARAARNYFNKHYGLSIRCVRDLTADYVCGDANSDGALNVSDGVFIINHVFVGGSAPDPNCCADCPPTVTDYDGNVYQTVLIGGQCWMRENLKVTHYRNGDLIPHVTDGGTWYGLTSGAYCNYNNDPANVATYGRLYNWYAVNDSRNIAPEGWHIPSDAEFKQLEMYLGMSQAMADGVGWRGTDEGGKLKEAGTTHWQSPNTGATNESGFTALPGGVRYIDFYYMGIFAHFWSFTEYNSLSAWYRVLYTSNSGVDRNKSSKQDGHSIRCVKD